MNNEKLLKQLIKQVKLLNIFVGFFGLLALTAIALIGFMLWQAMTYAQNAAVEIDEFRQETTQQLNVRQQACNDEKLGAFLKSSSDICN